MNIDLSEQTVTVFSVIGTAVIGFALFFWKASWWLRDQFQKVTDGVSEWMTAHEEKDQHRHEDNIQRFAAIETKLDIVIKNGHP